MDSLLQRTLHHALEYLDGLDRCSVAATVDLSKLRMRLYKSLQNETLSPEQVIDELVSDVDGGLVGSASGRFFGWVIGGSLPVSLAADWLTSTWDQNAALYASAPAAAITEEVVGLWLKDLLGLPKTASFALTTGCQMAHSTCLAAARYRLLQNVGWDVEEQGLFGAPSLRIVTSAHLHGSIVRAARLLGFGTQSIVALAVDRLGRLEESSLERTLAAAPAIPTIVVLQAGDLNIGAYDNFSSLIRIAKAFHAWVHIDGAFGLWLAASPTLRSMVEGVEHADSWSTDGHKWLNVPYDCGYAFVRDTEAHHRAMSHRSVYMVHDDDARDQVDWTPEWSRRGRGFASYAALRQLGRTGVADLIERCCRYARALVLGISGLPRAELLWEPNINQGLVRFLHPASHASDADHDAYTEQIMADIFRAGEAFFSGTTWQGRRAMRVSVCNWKTSEEDITRAVESVRQVLIAREQVSL